MEWIQNEGIQTLITYAVMLSFDREFPLSHAAKNKQTSN